MDHHSIARRLGMGDARVTGILKGLKKGKKRGCMDKKIAQLLEDIRKLLILDLVAKGIQSKHIARVLGVDNAVITRTVPAREIKKR